MILTRFPSGVILEGFLFGIILVVVLSLLLSFVEQGTNVIFKFLKQPATSGLATIQDLTTSEFSPRP